MSYTPTNWIDGETPVNAENLNKLEQAVQANDSAIAEINTALENGAGGESAVSSVNGKTGEVVLSAADVGALPLNGGGVVAAAKSNVFTINNTANANTYYVIQNNGANRATFGFVRSFACVSNEQAGGARIGVNENGVPQFRTTSNESTAKTLLHEGNAMELLESLGLKQAIVDATVDEVIAAIGTPVFGRVDENNNIILSGELVPGTYSLKYENADGDRTDIGSITVTQNSEVVTAIPLTLQLGKIDKTTGEITSTENNNYAYSNKVAIEAGKTYLLNYEVCANVSVCYYDANGNIMPDIYQASIISATSGVASTGEIVIPVFDGAAHFQFRLEMAWYGNGYGDSFTLAQNGLSLTALE